MKESGTWFPTDVEAAFAASVRLPRGTVLLVDTGSPRNIVGSEWVKEEAPEDPLGTPSMNKGFRGKAIWAADADKVWACLLYTSPSPRDKRQSRMPSSA